MLLHVTTETRPIKFLEAVYARDLISLEIDTLLRVITEIIANRSSFRFSINILE